MFPTAPGKKTDNGALQVEAVSITTPRADPGEFALNLTIRGKIIHASKKMDMEITVKCDENNMTMRRVNLNV